MCWGCCCCNSTFKYANTNRWNCLFSNWIRESMIQVHFEVDIASINSFNKYGNVLTNIAIHWMKGVMKMNCNNFLISIRFGVKQKGASHIKLVKVFESYQISILNGMQFSHYLWYKSESLIKWIATFIGSANRERR